MKLRASTIILASLLAVSVIGNAWLALSVVGEGVNQFYSDRYQQAEIAALRRFSERLAAGESAKAVLVDEHAVVDESGWLANSAIRAKFDGERLVKVCGSTSLIADACAEEAK